MTEPVHGGMAQWSVDGAGVVSERSYYERARATGAPPDVIAAVDILEDDGVSTERAVEIAMAAHRSAEAGRLRQKDAEAFARHFVKLRKAMRGTAGAP